MKPRYFVIAAMALAPLLLATPASAREYCREYTKTIRVGGKVQAGYGTACQQPDGAWKIVSTRGDDVDIYDHISDSIRRRDRHAVIIPHYAGRHRQYRHAYHYPYGQYKKHHKSHYKGKRRGRHAGYSGHKKPRYRKHDNHGSYFYFKF